MSARRPRRHWSQSIQNYYSPRYWLQVAALALIYIALAKFGLSLAYSTEQVTTVWPPTGFAVAALLIAGKRFWPAIFIGAFTANLITDETSAIALGIAAGNTLEAVTGAYLLRRFIKIDFGFSRLADFFGLLFLAGAVSTLISATIGTLSLTLGGIVEGRHFASTWLVWWIGDMMGALIVVPLILVFVKNRFAPLRQNPAEAILLLLLSLAVSILVFSQRASEVTALPYLIFPLIFWAAFRFCQAGAAIVIPVIAAAAIWGTKNDLGPFTLSGSTEHNLILLQTFLLVASATAMLMAIAVSQRQGTEITLRRRSRQLTELNRRITALLSGAGIDTAARKSKKP